jgi:hypothetical protein
MFYSGGPRLFRPIVFETSLADCQHIALIGKRKCGREGVGTQYDKTTRKYNKADFTPFFGPVLKSQPGIPFQAEEGK